MGVSIMSPISLLLLVPLTVSSLPVSLYSQGESLKDILRLLDRNATYYGVLRRAGTGTYRCIDDIDDAVDDALDDDIDDAKDAFVVSKVLSFLNKYRTPIINYGNNRFSNPVISSMVNPIMVSDLAQLCRDIGGRHAAVFRPDQTFRSRFPGIDANQNLLYSQGESLKNIVGLLDRNPTYAEYMRKAGARAYRCIDDIDDALDDDIEDAKDAFVVSKVVSFLNKYRTPIINYSKNRFSNPVISSMVTPIMVSDLAQLCRDIGGRHAAVFRPDQTFRSRFPGNIDVNQKFLFPFLERKKVRFGNSKFVTLVDVNDSDIDNSDFEDSDSDSDFD